MPTTVHAVSARIRARPTHLVRTRLMERIACGNFTRNVKKRILRRVKSNGTSTGRSFEDWWLNIRKKEVQLAYSKACTPKQKSGSTKTVIHRRFLPAMETAGHPRGKYALQARFNGLAVLCSQQFSLARNTLELRERYRLLSQTTGHRGLGRLPPTAELCTHASVAGHDANKST